MLRTAIQSAVGRTQSSCLRTRWAAWAAGLLILASPVFAAADPTDVGGRTYPIVDTMQDFCATDTSLIAPPGPGQAFYGQDAQYDGFQARYLDNGDGTVTDLVTGLMWQQAFSITESDDAPANAAAATIGGHTDWRVPTIKELYSLIVMSTWIALTRASKPRDIRLSQ